ncbi:MAG: PstC family ABC transporter permease, partial [Chloroflexota bacterium]
MSRASGPVAMEPPQPPRSRVGNRGDRVFKWTVTAAACAILVLVALIAFKMIDSSSLAIQRFGLAFLTGTSWDPVFEEFGALPFVYGTLVSSLLALLIGAPLSLGTAIWLAELAPQWLRSPVSALVELLAAIPSVVYGLWGIFILAPWLRSTVEPFLARVFGFLPLFQGPAY